MDRPPPGPGRRDRPAGQAGGPALLELFDIGPETAGRLLVSAEDNPERMWSGRAFAHLAGVVRIPMPSGRTHRHRRNRGGARVANNALLRTVVLGRMPFDERTRAYVERRTRGGLSKKDIVCCLKRIVAREVHRALTSAPAVHITPNDLAPAAWQHQGHLENGKSDEHQAASRAAADRARARPLRTHPRDLPAHA
ncbi:transposase [Streptomyces sp. NPDC090493]|uniref:transposase n=1 Tax=Streptomyces sp. NPDC090493 TaxID=3365964 RepID=UPI0037F23E5D